MSGKEPRATYIAVLTGKPNTKLCQDAFARKAYFLWGTCLTKSSLLFFVLLFFQVYAALSA